MYSSEGRMGHEYADERKQQVKMNVSVKSQTVQQKKISGQPVSSQCQCAPTTTEMATKITLTCRALKTEDAEVSLIRSI